MCSSKAQTLKPGAGNLQPGLVVVHASLLLCFNGDSGNLPPVQLFPIPGYMLPAPGMFSIGLKYNLSFNSFTPWLRKAFRTAAPAYGLSDSPRTANAFPARGFPALMLYIIITLTSGAA